MSLHRLARHPDTPSTAIERIEVDLEHDAQRLRLRYRIIGDAGRVVAPPPMAGKPPRRRDELWRGTCCELFVRDAGGAGYREYNFAPNGDWAAYRFSGYRTGMVALETPAPRIALERSPEAIALTVTLSDPVLDGAPTSAVPIFDAAMRIALACVVATDTEVSYWALSHPPGRPDFHHASAFALTLAVRQPAYSNA